MSGFESEGPGPELAGVSLDSQQGVVPNVAGSCEGDVEPVVGGSSEEEDEEQGRIVPGGSLDVMLAGAAEGPIMAVLGQLTEQHPQLELLLNGLTSFVSAGEELRGKPYDAEGEQAGISTKLFEAIGRKGLASALDPRLAELASEHGSMASCHLGALRSLSQNLKAQIDRNPEFFGTRGSVLNTGLERLVAKFDKGPFREEDRLISEAIQDYVVKVFEEIQQDSSNLCLSMHDCKTQIDDLLKKVQAQSTALGAESLLPERLPLEEVRTILVQKVWKLHDSRAKLVAKPSRVPELLQSRRRQFKASNDEHINKLREDQAKHRSSAKHCHELVTQQEQFKRQKLEECEGLQRQSKQRECDLNTQLQCTIRQACEKLVEALQLAEAIRIERVLSCESQLERGAVESLMTDHIDEQNKQKEQHGLLCERYDRGCEFLAEFAQWLENSYSWMEQNLQEKRSVLEQELPFERNRFRELLKELGSDLNRRIDEQRWAMQLTVKKRDEAELEAARLERVRGKVRDARDKKDEVHRMEADLHSMQGIYEGLCGLWQDVQSKLNESTDGSTSLRQSSSTLQQCQQWVQSIFFNDDLRDPHFVPPALCNMAEPSARYLQDGASEESFEGSSAGGGGGFIQKALDVLRPSRLRKRKKSAPGPNEWLASSHEQGGPTKRWRGSSWSSASSWPVSPPPPPPPVSHEKGVPVKRWQGSSSSSASSFILPPPEPVPRSLACRQSAVVMPATAHQSGPKGRQRALHC